MGNRHFDLEVLRLEGKVESEKIIAIELLVVWSFLDDLEAKERNQVAFKVSLRNLRFLEEFSEGVLVLLVEAERNNHLVS